MELKKLNSLKIQGRNGQMNWIAFIPRKEYKWSKKNEELFNIPSHEGNANQKHVKIPPHSY
jgi:hypothetical protein